VNCFFKIYVSTIKCSLNMIVICVLLGLLLILCVLKVDCRMHCCQWSCIQRVGFFPWLFLTMCFFQLLFLVFFIDIFSSDNIWFLLSLMLIFVNLNFHHHLPHTILHINFQSPTQTWCLCKSYKECPTKQN